MTISAWIARLRATLTVILPSRFQKNVCGTMTASARIDSRRATWTLIILPTFKEKVCNTMMASARIGSRRASTRTARSTRQSRRCSTPFNLRHPQTRVNPPPRLSEHGCRIMEFSTRTAGRRRRTRWTSRRHRWVSPQARFHRLVPLGIRTRAARHANTGARPAVAGRARSVIVAICACGAHRSTDCFAGAPTHRMLGLIHPRERRRPNT
mmetsp:Transcript_88143/g.247940  ORF Transcript_88143/g.247940 Transcript_88143/m.247940 type:complete len:210 (-) Transcript_88143:100-729(-)